MIVSGVVMLNYKVSMTLKSLKKSLKKWATLTLSLLGVLVFSGCWGVVDCCAAPLAPISGNFYVTIRGSSVTNDYTIATRDFPNSESGDGTIKEFIRGTNPFRIRIFHFPLRWDSETFDYESDYSIPALAKTNIYLEIDNPNANALNIRVLPIVANLTNSSLNQNYLNQSYFNQDYDSYGSAGIMMALTNYLGINQEVCYFPDVRIEIAAGTSAVVDLPITNDVAGNGYYCYAAPVNSFELKY